MYGRKNKENCALKLVDEIILYYDARSKKHKKNYNCEGGGQYKIQRLNTPVLPWRIEQNL